MAKQPTRAELIAQVAQLQALVAELRQQIVQFQTHHRRIAPDRAGPFPGSAVHVRHRGIA